MESYEAERQRNLEAYERLRDEIHGKYQGQYVAIANGELVKVSPSFDEVDEAVKGYRHRLVFPAGEAPELGPSQVRSLRLGHLIG